MSVAGRGTQLTFPLLLICIGLGALIAWEWHGVSPGLSGQGRMIDPQVALPVSQPDTTYTPPGIEAFDEILARPLFVPGREPPEAPLAANATPAVESVPMRLRLEGVAITPETRVAVVRDLRSNELLRLGEGMSHDGWRVAQVLAGRAVMQRGTATEELKLELDAPDRKKGVPPGLFRLPSTRSGSAPKAHRRPLTVAGVPERRKASVHAQQQGHVDGAGFPASGDAELADAQSPDPKPAPARSPSAPDAPDAAASPEGAAGLAAETAGENLPDPSEGNAPEPAP